MVQRGALIVFEGLDRSGKTTQVDRLIARLQKEGRKARLQKFPGMSSHPCLLPAVLVPLTS